MKKTKTALWIVLLFILQSSAAHYIAVWGATPILIFSFIAAFAILEDNFRYASLTGLICGIIAGALMGYNFFVCALFVALAVIVVFSLRGRPLYMSDILKVLMWTAIISLVWEAVGVIGQFIKSGASARLVGVNIIVRVVYNTAIALIVYPLLKRSMYSSEKRSKL